MLEVTGVTKDFTPPPSLGRLARLDFAPAGKVRALDNVSFSLQKGSVLAILGPNGAGKTTLLKIISTLILPDSGAVKIGGFYLGKDDDAIKACVGLMASAERSFYWRLTGRQNMEFFAALYGLSKERTRERLEELFGLFGVDYADRRFDGYSSGMQQRFALMRAILHEPELLLLDEPTKSLDYSAAAELRDLIKNEFVAKRNKAVIFTTHHMDEAADFADRFIILHKGKLLAFGSLEDLRRHAGRRDATLGEIFMELTKGR